MTVPVALADTRLGSCGGDASGGSSRFHLVDLQHRAVRYLRISVTDRCNFRCTYCMPAEGVPVAPRADILRYDEIARLARIFVTMGIDRLRLTGGEPLVRRDLVDLVAQLAAIPGLQDLALTTNGYALDRLAAPLRAAGLRRLNVSVDSLDPATFAQMTRTGALADVLRGLDAADAAGFVGTKLNAVILRGDNDHEVPALAAFAQRRGYVLRLIEFMPIGLDERWGAGSFVAAEELRARLTVAGWALQAAPRGDMVLEAARGGGPARYWTATPPDGGRPLALGFITAVSDHFCATCNRVRLAANGTLRECLSAPGRLSLRDAMRAGLDDAALAALIGDALLGKVDGHRFAAGVRTREAMSSIGG